MLETICLYCINDSPFFFLSLSFLYPSKKKNKMIQTTTSTDKKREAVKSSQSANNDDKMPVMRDVGTWTPSRKQQSSLTHLKSKFAAKSSVMDIGIATNHASMEEDILPWQQFGVPTEQQQLSTAPKDYHNMLQELNVTHAVMVTSKFKPVDFVQAEQLVQASCFELTIARLRVIIKADM